jgi:hypothetical protein
MRVWYILNVMQGGRGGIKLELVVIVIEKGWVAYEDEGGSPSSFHLG